MYWVTNRRTISPELSMENLRSRKINRLKSVRFIINLLRLQGGGGFWFVCAFVLLMNSDPVWAKDDFQYRQIVTVKMLDTETLDFSLQGQLRLNHDAHDVYFTLVSPQLKYDLTKNLAFGLYYTYLNT